MWVSMRAVSTCECNENFLEMKPGTYSIQVNFIFVCQLRENVQKFFTLKLYGPSRQLAAFVTYYIYIIHLRSFFAQLQFLHHQKCGWSVNRKLPCTRYTLTHPHICLYFIASFNHFHSEWRLFGDPHSPLFTSSQLKYKFFVEWGQTIEKPRKLKQRWRRKKANKNRSDLLCSTLHRET